MTHRIKELSESIPSNEMFYNDKAIRLGSFIGGPLMPLSIRRLERAKIYPSIHNLFTTW